METVFALAERLLFLFGWLDLVAVTVFFGASLTMTALIERRQARRPSVAVLMQRYRRDWMQAFAERENRIFDAALLTTLRAGAAFFASTCLIAIGGTAALLGQTERVLMLARDLGADPSTAARSIWEAKLLVVLVLLVNAFLKFVWSHRLFGYVAVVMGAMPGPGTANEMAVERASRLQDSAGRSFNRGLRTVYFTLAALAWFLGPLALILASLATAAMLYRREFLSASRRALARE